MTNDRVRTSQISRRAVLAGLTGAAGLGALGPLGGAARAQTTGPWAQAPASKVDKLTFVVWTYGDIYTRISKQFETDWGVKLESTISPYNDHPTKLATMFAASEKIDVSQASPISFPNFVHQGLVEPIDGLPGAADYVKDFTAFTRQAAQYGGKTMGLPYFSTVWVWNYYTENLEKAKISKPFATYEEFIEHCVKAKRDGVSRYPVLWVAQAGQEQLPGTWFQLTHNRGGALFDKQGQHMLGPGSIARDTLKWWANTFTKGLDISDPESLKVSMTTSAKAFSAGKSLYRGPNHHYGLNVVNDPAQSPIAGKVKVLGSPGDGRTIGVTNIYFLSTASRSKEWAWKLLQYLGGKTKDGQYTQAVNLARDAMLGSGYQSVMQSDAVKKGWTPWGDAGAILKMWDKATYIGEVCNSAYQPWHSPWNDRLNIEVQRCLTGQITADQCCDALIKGIAEAKKKI